MNALHQRQPGVNRRTVYIRIIGATNGNLENRRRRPQAADNIIEHESLNLRPLTMDEQVKEDAVYLPGRTLDQLDKRIILAALDHDDGHREKTTKELGIGVSTLREKLMEMQNDEPDAEP